ncbi:hypothetical protein CVT26_003720 [Gymnopilus dilepis]|uniref:Uncharacterized protein n=1 Tax=Gymnopilus dilepis TaxID=231916 RepID=A0A409YXJ3_9AGAR|nr:hypothetical protein CVT26_003720 [Gymnopilus dilepis]
MPSALWFEPCESLSMEEDPLSREKRLKRKREHYRVVVPSNAPVEREKARKRALRRKAKSEEEERLQKERRRYHDARYREEHRETLRLKAIQYRLANKRRKAIEADEDKYQKLMSLDFDDAIELSTVKQDSRPGLVK